MPACCGRPLRGASDSYQLRAGRGVGKLGQ